MFSAIFKIMGVDAGFTNAIQGAQGSINSLVGAAIPGLGAIMASASALQKIFSSITAAMSESLEKAKLFTNDAARLGMTAGEVAKLDRFCQQTGTSIDSMGRGMMLLEKFSTTALDGTNKKTNELVQKLHMSKEELHKMQEGGPEAFALLADKMKGIASEGERAAIAQGVLGRRAYEFNNLLEAGGKFIRDNAKDATAMSEGTIATLAPIQHEFGEIGAELKKLAGELVQALAPLMPVIDTILRVFMMILRVINLVTLVFEWWQYQFAWLVLKATQFYNIFATNKIDTTDMEKSVDKLGKKMKDTGNNMVEGWKRDVKAIGSSIEAATADLPEERRRGGGGGGPVRDELTEAEKEAAEKAKKAAEHEERQARLANATKEEKLALLDEEIAKQDELIEAIKKEHPELYKNTAEYMKAEAEKTKFRAEQEKIRRELEKKENDFKEKNALMFDAFDRKIEENRIKRQQEDNHATKAEVFKAQMDSIYGEASKALEELSQMESQKGKFTPEQLLAKRKEFLSIVEKGDKEEMKMEEEARKTKANITADSLQKIGGGGATFLQGVGDTKKQIELARSQLAELMKLVELEKKIAAKSTTATYGGTSK